MAAAEILFTHNNLHSGSSGQEPTLLAGRMGLASNLGEREEGEGPDNRKTAKREKKRIMDPCGFFASDDFEINFLLAILFPHISHSPGRHLAVMCM